MAKHSDTSWKQDHPSTLLSNSVQKANRAVKQAISHPDSNLVEQAHHALVHAEHALTNAEQFQEHMDTVQQNKELLETIKQELQQAEETMLDN